MQHFVHKIRPGPGMLSRAGLALIVLLWATAGMCETGPSEHGVASSPVQASALCPPQTHGPLPQVKGDANDERTHVEADSANINLENISVFRGNVEVRRGLNQLNADQVDYDREQDSLHAEGNVELMRNDLLINGEQADIAMKTGTGQINNATYRTAANQQGKAETIEVLDKYRTALQGATFTTCDISDPDWLLSAGHIMLNNENRQGTADDVVLRFKGVPFMYLPYMRFPIGDERLSGLLYPTVGTSDNLGTQLILPFYWNIAPQADATIAVNYMSRRGTMLENEFRYLTQSNNGQLDFNYLPNDDVYNADRELFRWQHLGNEGLGWNARVNYNYVSDDDYFFDFGNNLTQTSTTYLPRRGLLNYNAENWQFYTLAEDYQPINAAETYQRMPQFGFSSRLPLRDNSLNYALDAEWVQFKHRDAPTVAQGVRYNIAPSVSLPLRNIYGFIEPKLEVLYTQYNLDPDSTTGEPDLTRTVPVFSIDNGLFFERNTRINETDLLQTLEPQLLYAYVPYRDQSDLPVFDTTYYGFNYNDPFRINRFYGIDRIGDTNQLTAALTTRLISRETGHELLMARIGQIYYFEDRLVTLPGGTPETNQRSNIIAELNAQPNRHWVFSGDLSWSTQDNQFDTGNALLRYRPTDDISLHAAYRFQRDLLETNEVGFDWRVSPRWKFNGRRLYDLDNQRELESTLGVRYDSCCWGFSLEAGRRFISIDRPQDNTVLLVLELKGLGSLGN